MRASSVMLLVFLCIATAVFAQEGNADLLGVVQDTSNAVLPDAKVVAINTDTNQRFQATTSQDGRFNLMSLPVGPYQIRVERAGFKSILKEGLFLHTEDKLKINFQMEVGSAVETVAVSGEAINVNTTDATVSTVIDRHFADNLPMNGRSFQSLLYVTPGVTQNPGASGASKGQFVVNGQRGDANYWIIDGVGADIGIRKAAIPGVGLGGSIGATNGLGGTNALVSVDALQEFRIETSSYAPEFGRVPGGQISIRTRSGTNQFHGTAFDYFRNTVLDAKDWFADHYNLSKAAERQNDFGGVLGGPILKDKTFFFFSYEGVRLTLPFIFAGTVPDLASRSAAIPSVQPYLNAYPVPTPGAQPVPGTPGIVTYNATYTNNYRTSAYSLRIDHQLTKNLQLFARYSHAPSYSKERGGALNSGSEVTSATKTATAGATWVMSPWVVNDVRFNFSVSGGRNFAFTDTLGGGTPLPGENLFPKPFTLQNGDFYFIPLFGSGMGEVNGFIGASYQHQYNIVDTLAVHRGAHDFKFGADYRRLSPKVGFANYQLLDYFSDMASLEQGSSLFTVAAQNLRPTFLLRDLGLYAQDTWRVSSRLDLTYGLRWDVSFTPASESGPSFPALTGFNPTDMSQLALAPAGTPAYSTRYRNVAPRIGGAYRLLTSPDRGLVLRGGFGVFYGLPDTVIANAPLINASYPFGGVAVFSPAAFPTTPQDAALPPIVPPNSQNFGILSGLDPHLNAPRALEWNVALEQSLGAAQTFSLTYVGASDTRMLQSVNIANPNPNNYVAPNYYAADVVANLGTSSYHALQAKFQRRLTNGLQALVSYSWAHSIDDGSYGDYANGGFADIKANRGDSDYDLRNVFTAAVTYNVPTARSNLITRAVTSGWRLNNIVQIHSGPPLDVIDGNYAAIKSISASVVIRPDIVPGQPLYLNESSIPGGRMLNPAAFTDPPVDATTGLPNRQGDLARNSLRSFGLMQWDFAVHREFSLEKVKLQFRAEMFNVLNHPNFGPFNNYFVRGNPFFGQATQMQNQLGGGGINGDQTALYAVGGPRSVQLALKLVF